MNIRNQLLAALVVSSGIFIYFVWRSFRDPQAPNAETRGFPSLLELGLGFVTNFFDTLGIGSFAPTTSAFRLLKMVPDPLIPGTMLAGHGLAVVVQAMVFITVVEMEARLLLTMIAATLAGAWLGVGVVASLPRRALRAGMGLGLLIAAAFMLLARFGLMPEGGTAVTVDGGKFAIAVAAHFAMGALLSIGIGNYGPSLVLFSVLGMDPRVAFPVMMGAGAFVGTVAGIRFVKTGFLHVRAGMGLALGGIPGVLLAAFLVRSLPLDILRWVVLVVVLYTAITLLRAAMEVESTSAGRG